jgi:hypothetical protein
MIAFLRPSLGGFLPAASAARWINEEPGSASQRECARPSSLNKGGAKMAAGGAIGEANAERRRLSALIADEDLLSAQARARALRVVASHL